MIGGKVGVSLVFSLGEKLRTTVLTSRTIKIALLLRSTLDLADRLSSKATSDPIIEGMLAERTLSILSGACDF